jgi:hypothetical protein
VAGGVRRDRVLVAVAKILAGAVVLALGFRAVSDDDFARVVIAQGFAVDPSLDPSGTSWLPLPFWLTGGAMALLGRSLLVARAVAVLLGIAAALALHEAALWIARDRARALVGALIAAVLPWSARLGVAVVPELPVAAAIVVAAASTAPGWTPRRRLWGGLALAAACLARYEPWLVAAPFAALTVWDARALSRGVHRLRLAVAALAPIAACGAWIAWNAHAHGDALAFLERVASYRKALGGGATGLAGAAIEYGRALLVAEPQLVLGAIVIVVAAVPFGVGRDLRTALRRPAALLGALVVLLVAAGVRDGAPTHHPERALLAALLLLAIVAGALAVDLVRAHVAPSRRGWVVGSLIIALLVARSVGKRHPPTLLAREAEVAIGQLVGDTVPAGEKVLVEVEDYGYFAVLAGSGRPEDLVPDRDLDPRRPAVASAFHDPAAIAARAGEVGARWAVGRQPMAGLTCVAYAAGWCVARVGEGTPAG